jgi:hypothetical protein
MMNRSKIIETSARSKQSELDMLSQCGTCHVSRGMKMQPNNMDATLFLHGSSDQQCPAYLIREPLKQQRVAYPVSPRTVQTTFNKPN